MGLIIAMVSGKGGVGKTTLTAGLGGAMARRGKKILVTDGDLGLRDLDLVIGKENEILYDALDVWKKRCRPEDAIVSVTEGLDFLPASQSVRWEDVGRKGYGRLLKKMAKQYDYVIVDAPAGIGRGNDAILRVAQRLVIVTEPAWVALRNAQRVMQVCREQRQLDYALVFNRINPHMSVANIEEAWYSLSAEMLGAVLPYSEAVWQQGQAGQLYEPVTDTFDNLLTPLCDFCQSGTAWVDTAIFAQYASAMSAEQKKFGENKRQKEQPRLLVRQRDSRWRRLRR